MSFQERENTSRTENGWPAQDLYHEYLPGDTLLFPLCTFDGQNRIQVETKSVVIEDIRGGGFFGQVLIPGKEDFVVKTSLPDPWHHFWRTVNWDFRDIPARDDETQTQLTHLAVKLIHDVLPIVSNNRFYSPDSLGYTRLATGFAQVVEKLDGRGPRFDLSTNEYDRFRQAQSQLRRIAYSLGLEHVGQIHPDNPFAMANLWFDEKNKQFIWLDTIPAIPHKGWIWPFFNYPFHQKIRDHFDMKEPTFDRIHTDRFRMTIKQWESNFDPGQYAKIMANLELYDELQKRSQRIPEEPQYDTAIRELWASLINFCSERSVYKLLAEPVFRNEKLAFLRDLYHDPVYRVTWVNNNFILAGIEKA
ncbi:hypothetical protein MUP32_00830, partial [Candidatus Microgenomates bacterium]|nr:hypothetical protein [Candidatus Microgenomates bacterium]